MIEKMIFNRLFSLTMYKNKTIPLGEMSFSKDFINDTRGNLYPVLKRSDNCIETLKDGKYTVEQGEVRRFICRFFPYASYRIEFTDLQGETGFEFDLKKTKASITYNGSLLSCKRENNTETTACKETECMIISCRPAAFDIYFEKDGCIEFIHTFLCDNFGISSNYDVFSRASAALTVKGSCTVKSVTSYIDCGISQADMRPIRYENGDVMVEGGKVYLTMSIRMQKNMFQGIFSWVPGTADIDLTGVLFYDCGDGRWCGDVAASVLYNREDNNWYLWVASFNRGHILGHAKFESDIRFGVNVLDFTLMNKEEGSGYTDFAASVHDEDPDFYYDNEKNKWYMAICRKDPKTKAYRYAFFESDKPFNGYKFIGCGKDGAETGGSFVKVNGERLFICGNDFNATSDYRIYSKNGMSNAHFDYPDGGFRGWGTLMPIKLGSRTRYFWMTFDRHNGSDFNWSYGNIYCFEGNC